MFLFFMRRRPPRSTRTDTHFPDTPLCRSLGRGRERLVGGEGAQILSLRAVERESRHRALPRRHRIAEPALHVAAGGAVIGEQFEVAETLVDRKSTRLNSSH